jgi:spermidine synthase
MSMAERVVATTKNGTMRLVAVDAGGETHFELYAQGALQMSTCFSDLALQLAQAALSGVTGRHVEVLVGGLGLGLTLRHILDHDAVQSVCVVELEPRVIEWNRTHLGNADLLDDRRVELIVGDFCDYVQGAPRNYHGIVLHIDEGPDRVLRSENRRGYSLQMLQILQSRLRFGGALAVRASQSIPSYERALGNHFTDVECVPVSDKNIIGENQMCVVYQARA